ncbi:uncharacterized protein EDB91DRAFT_1079668 [Suillus paluster]|uniref:uncharacterized protein n=1 Tax=Suillus paluster TaxID=48578 RepID=UPI001B87DA76|nr:uncharacterized protein EDB91DRAFT_1079668 [Suillus paluster]KAG1747027.1 hypothetical protein EDB91DRAFT_1079668 [Suillus paluster]
MSGKTHVPEGYNMDADGSLIVDGATNKHHEVISPSEGIEEHYVEASGAMWHYCKIGGMAIELHMMPDPAMPLACYHGFCNILDGAKSGLTILLEVVKRGTKLCQKHSTEWKENVPKWIGVANPQSPPPGAGEGVASGLLWLSPADRESAAGKKSMPGVGKEVSRFPTLHHPSSGMGHHALGAIETQLVHEVSMDIDVLYGYTNQDFACCQTAPPVFQLWDRSTDAVHSSPTSPARH